MQPIDLLLTPRWVLPIEPDGAVLEGHSVAISAGRILEIGPTAALLGRYAPATRAERARHVLMPGLVDAHTSAARALLRDALPRGPVAQWLGNTLRPLENRWSSPEFVRAGALHAIAGMLRAGITTFASVDLFPEEIARLAGELRMRVVVGLPVIEARTPWAEGADDCLDRAASLWDAHKSDPWARLQFVPDAPGSLPTAALERLRRIADQLDAPVAMRIHAHAPAVRAFTGEHGLRPLEWLDAAGLLRAGFTALHANDLSADDIEILCRSGVGVVQCPSAGLRLGNGVTPLAALRAEGACVALGTGSAAAGLGLPDVLAEARLAALLAAVPGNPEGSVPDATTVLRMATLEGAQVLGLAADIGSIEAGKSADLACIDLGPTGVEVAARVPEALVYDATARDVTDVWIAGRAHLAAGQPCSVDAERAAEDARRWATRMGIGVAR